VTRTESEKQAWVDFVTTTSALLDVSFSSGCGRCSNQYHAPPSAAKKTTAIAGLRYSERFIAGSIQTYAGNTISDFIQSLRAQAKQSGPAKQVLGCFVAEPVIGRARIRATRWLLAMTEKNSSLSKPTSVPQGRGTLGSC